MKKILLSLALISATVPAWGMDTPATLSPQDALLDAAKSGNLEQFKKAIEDGACVNRSSSWLFPWVNLPLQFAIKNGHKNIVEFLIEPKFKLPLNMPVTSSFGEERFYPLEYAIVCGHADIVKLLLKKKFRARFGRIAGLLIGKASQEVELAVKHSNGKTDILNVLYKAGYTVRYTPDGYATRFWDRETYPTAFGCAVLHNYIDIVKLIIEKEANIIKPRMNPKDYICSAMSNSNLDILQLLLKSARPSSFDDSLYKKHISPIETAVRSGKIDMLKFVLESDNPYLKQGGNPIATAVRSGKIDMLKLLFKSSKVIEDINKPDVYLGYRMATFFRSSKVLEGTLLQLAILKDHTNLIPLLFAHGARVGEEELKLARRENNMEMEKLLLTEMTIRFASKSRVKRLPLKSDTASSPASSAPVILIPSDDQSMQEISTTAIHTASEKRQRGLLALHRDLEELFLPTSDPEVSTSNATTSSKSKAPKTDWEKKNQ